MTDPRLPFRESRGYAGSPSGRPGGTAGARTDPPVFPGGSRRRVRRLPVAAAVLLRLSGVGAAPVHRDLNGNIDLPDIDKQPDAGSRPERTVQGAANVLLLGSDSRSGANRAYGRDDGGARSLDGLDADPVDFRTLPLVPAPQDPNRVVPEEPQANAVWKALTEDRPLPARSEGGERS